MSLRIISVGCVMLLLCTTKLVHSAAVKDTFSGASIDSGLWYSKDAPLNKNDTHNRRRIVIGQLELFAESTGTSGNYTTNTTTIHFQESLALNYVQTDVAISSQSSVPSTGLGQVRVEGAFYNSKHSMPRGSELLDGEVFASVRINQNGDGSFTPFGHVFQCDDDACDSNTTQLYSQPIGCTIEHDIPVTVSILFNTPQDKADPTLSFTFSCADESKTTNNFTTPYHGSNSKWRRLRTRSYVNNGGTSMQPTALQVNFDNYQNYQTCTEDGWCVEETPEAGYFLNGIWGSSDRDIYAIGRDSGSKGSMFHYDGSSWSRLTPDMEEVLNGICGFGADDIYVVGANGYISHFDGASWSKMTSSTSKDVRDVWCHDVDNVYSVDVNGGVHRFDGSSWSQVYSGNIDHTINVIWGSNTDDIYIGGRDSSSEGVLLHYDGSVWTSIDLSLGMFSQYYDIWGADSDTVFIAGTYGISTFNGSVWNTDNPNGMFMHSIWGFEENDVYVADDVGQILHYNGTDWKVQKTPNVLPAFNWYNGIWGACPTDVFAVGSQAIIHKKTKACSTSFNWNIYLPAFIRKNSN